MRNKWKRFSLFLLLNLPLVLFGHAPDQSYTFLRIYESAIEGRFEITTDDLNRVLGLGLEEGLSPADVEPVLPLIHAYIRQKAGFRSKYGEHPLRFTKVGIFEGGTLGDYVQIFFALDNLPAVPDTLVVRNEILLDPASDHRGLGVVEYNWKAGIHNNESMVSLRFAPGDAEQALDLTDASVLKGFVAMVHSGMHHIYIGIDHILFLLALLLPAVVRRRSRQRGEALQLGLTASATLEGWRSDWVPVARFRPAFWYVIKIITLFTVAHSITLSLAALGIVSLPSRLVESVIALSIALAALHNIHPLSRHSDWLIVFGFGLFHGFGFASVLGDLGLSGEFMTLTLLGFNLGVEIGQVLIISLIFPVLYFLRRWRHYPSLLIYGSGVLILIALYWFFERSLEVDFLLDNYIGAALDKLRNVLSG